MCRHFLGALLSAFHLTLTTTYQVGTIITPISQEETERLSHVLTQVVSGSAGFETGSLLPGF